MTAFAPQQYRARKCCSVIPTRPDSTDFRFFSTWNSLRTHPPARGNQAMQQLLRTGAIQAKLKINEEGGSYEQEADRVAEQVMWMAESPKAGIYSGVSTSPIVQRRAKDSRGDDVVAPAIVNEVLSSPGRPLDTDTRNYFEPRFGYDFSQVRLYTGARAAESARAINALAYTTGNNIVFGALQHAHNTRDGQKLLAHELTHVVQQQGFQLPRPGIPGQKYMVKTSGFEKPDNELSHIIQQTGAPANLVFRQTPQPGDELREPLEPDEETIDLEDEDFGEPFELDEEQQEFDDASPEEPQEVADPCDMMREELDPLLASYGACREIERHLWALHDKESERDLLQAQKSLAFREIVELDNRKTELEPDLTERQNLHDERLFLLLENEEELTGYRGLAKEVFDQATANLDGAHTRYWTSFQQISETIKKRNALYEFIKNTTSKKTLSPLELFHLWVALHGYQHYAEKVDRLMAEFEEVSDEFEKYMEAESRAFKAYSLASQTLSKNRDLIDTLLDTDPTEEIQQLKARMNDKNGHAVTLETKIKENYDQIDKIKSNAMNANLQCVSASKKKVLDTLKMYLIECEDANLF